MNLLHAAAFVYAPERESAGAPSAELQQAREQLQRLTETNAQLQDAIDKALRREKELQDNEALYVSLVDNLPVHVFRKDPAGRFIFCNRAFCTALKQPRKKSSARPTSTSIRRSWRRSTSTTIGAFARRAKFWKASRSIRIPAASASTSRS